MKGRSKYISYLSAGKKLSVVMVLLAFAFVNYGQFFHHHSSAHEHDCTSGRCNSLTNIKTEGLYFSALDLESEHNNCLICTSITFFSKSFDFPKQIRFIPVISSLEAFIYKASKPSYKLYSIRNKAPPVC